MDTATSHPHLRDRQTGITETDGQTDRPLLLWIRTWHLDLLPEQYLQYTVHIYICMLVLVAVFIFVGLLNSETCSTDSLRSPLGLGFCLWSDSTPCKASAGFHHSPTAQPRLELIKPNWRSECLTINRGRCRGLQLASVLDTKNTRCVGVVDWAHTVSVWMAVWWTRSQTQASGFSCTQSAPICQHWSPVWDRIWSITSNVKTKRNDCFLLLSLVNTYVFLVLLIFLFLPYNYVSFVVSKRDVWKLLWSFPWWQKDLGRSFKVGRETRSNQPLVPRSGRGMCMYSSCAWRMNLLFTSLDMAARLV